MSELRFPEPEPAPGDLATPGPPARTVSSAVPPKCETRTRLYRSGVVRAEGFPAEDIRGHLQESDDAVVWLDLFDPDTADLQIVVEEFGLHPLAVEDAVHDHQRPKLDRYNTHLFANMYAVALDPGTQELTTSEISAFITPRALITVRKAEFDVDTLLARWDAAQELAGSGVGFLVHGLLDAIVDGHDAAVEQLDDAVDALEDMLFERSRARDIRRRGFELRKTMAQLRRVVSPMREVVGRLLRSDTYLVSETMAPYFQDVEDHVLRAVDGVESARDLINSIVETEFNEQGNELNEITRKLAAWAAIIAVPTAVTGFYGQNIPYPGFGHTWGFVLSTVVILVLGGGLYLMLRRRGWL
jgi:magnesium transporter